MLNEQRQALVDARKESLTIQGRFLAELIAAYATYEDPSQGFDQFTASEILQRSCRCARLSSRLARALLA